ncbi:kinase-like protein [Rickenella mellea]|uniref:Kinase-like protein n=1 Tax=Rickenella mellea TaxID=50990 RepID=A0A4Y7PJH1_9AGAM|nr:kinase-like protein [Rickenella mellea]
MLDRDEADIRFQIQDIAIDQSQRQLLLEACLENPAPLVNLLQMLLDLDSGSSGSNRLLVRMVAWLAMKTGTYPDCLTVSQIRYLGDHPVSGGGFADIWRGELIDRPVALKVLRVFFNDAPKKKETVFQNFAHEAVVWRQLRHKNILPFYGIFKGSASFDRLCLVSPWMEAGNIINFLKHSPDSDRISLLGDVVDGLRYLHEFEPTVVHGDLKGSNIFVTPAQTACLADFGLTRFRNPQYSSGESTTDSLRGTIRWQARELLVPDDDGKVARPSRESDTYSFGCVCLEVMTGNVPFSELTDMAVTFAIMQNKLPKRPVGHCIEYGLDDSLWNIIERCWDIEPSQRPAIVQLSQYFNQRRTTMSNGLSCHHDLLHVSPASLENYGFPESSLLQIAQGTPVDTTTVISHDLNAMEEVNVDVHEEGAQPYDTSEMLLFPTDFIVIPSSANESVGEQTLVDHVAPQFNYMLGPSLAHPSADTRTDRNSQLWRPTIQEPKPPARDDLSVASQSVLAPINIDRIDVMAPTPTLQTASILRSVNGITNEDGSVDLATMSRRRLQHSHFRSVPNGEVIHSMDHSCMACAAAKLKVRLSVISVVIPPS